MAIGGKPLLRLGRVGRRDSKGQRWLIHDASLDVAGGDRIALCGPTGSGKSVLLRAVAMLDELDEGKILLGGEEVLASHVPSYRWRISYLRQRPAMIEGTVLDDLCFPFRLKLHRHRSFDRDRVARYLKTLSLNDDFLHKPATALSGGESQLVSLLRSLQLDPQLLLLDEPTSALDAVATQRVEALIDRWLNEAPSDRAFIWVTHDTAQAARVANRRIWMRQGLLRVTEAEHAG